MSSIEEFLDTPKRRLYLLGDVNEDMLLKTLLAFDLLESRSKTRPINITISTYGGLAYESLGIYDRIRASPCRVKITATGPLMSAGTIILQAGDQRLLTPNVRMMIHYGSTSVDEERAIDAEAQISFEKSTDRPKMEDIYLRGIQRKSKNFKRTQIQKMLSKDTFLTAEEAVALGLADKVLK